MYRVTWDRAITSHVLRVTGSISDAGSRFTMPLLMPASDSEPRTWRTSNGSHMLEAVCILKTWSHDVPRQMKIGRVRALALVFTVFVPMPDARIGDGRAGGAVGRASINADGALQLAMPPQL